MSRRRGRGPTKPQVVVITTDEIEAYGWTLSAVLNALAAAHGIIVNFLEHAEAHELGEATLSEADRARARELLTRAEERLRPKPAHETLRVLHRLARRLYREHDAILRLYEETPRLDPFVALRASGHADAIQDVNRRLETKVETLERHVAAHVALTDGK